MPDWQKLTVDWPCAVGDFLWALVIVQTAKWLNDLTFKRMMFTVGVILAVIAVSQAFPPDVAVILAGDAMTYFEVASAVMLIAARGRIYTSLRVSLHILRHTGRRVAATARLAFGRSKQTRRIAAYLRNRNRNSGDDGEAWPVSAALAFG